MKEEMKIVIICIVLSCVFMSFFGFVTSSSEYVYYVHQVGIYKDEVNKDKKINELKSMGYECVYYMKDDQYYVISLISDNKDKMDSHSKEVKGIIKEYKTSSKMSVESLLKQLEKGE